MCICLSAGCPELLQIAQKLTDMARVVSSALIGKLSEDPVSVLGKVQSCVTYWHIYVCFEYHWVLRFLLSEINLLSVGSIGLSSQPEKDKYSHSKNAVGQQYQWRCLTSSNVWFFILFYNLVTRWQPLSWIRIQQPCFVPCLYTIMW